MTSLFTYQFFSLFEIRIIFYLSYSSNEELNNYLIGRYLLKKLLNTTHVRPRSYFVNDFRFFQIERKRLYF